MPQRIHPQILRKILFSKNIPASVIRSIWPRLIMNFRVHFRRRLREVDCPFTGSTLVT